jgi:CrcB protein
VDVREALAIGLFGLLGTLARYGIARGLVALWGEAFPYGTLAVNVLGCLGLGVCAEALFATDAIAPAWRFPISVGFFGGFTTFSAFGYETVRLAQGGAVGLALLNVATNLIVGLGATWLGLVAGRALAT